MTIDSLLALLPTTALIAAVGLGVSPYARPWPAKSFLACYPPIPGPLLRLAGPVALHLLKCLGLAPAPHDA